MSFCWKDYLQLANELIESSKNSNIEEAYLRSSISRSYYGIFCIARNYLVDKKGATIEKDDTHKFVREKFITSNNQSEQIVGEILKNFRFDRNKVDYNDNCSFNYQYANNICTWSNCALNKLKNLGANI